MFIENRRTIFFCSLINFCAPDIIEAFFVSRRRTIYFTNSSKKNLKKPRAHTIMNHSR